MDAKIKFTLNYHNETKHLINRPARSLGYLDWNNQPNPFRFFEGCKQIPLKFSSDLNKIDHSDIYDHDSIGIFLEHALSLSAWKAIQNNRWALRVNPSSGNLHPTEGYLVLPSGVYHYSPYLHALEQRVEIPVTLAKKLADFFGGEGFLVGLSSIYWREAWKYGERAYRYCNHDVGHALGALSISAKLLGWNIVTLDFFATSEINTILGLNLNDQIKDENEQGDILCYVYKSRELKLAGIFPQEIIQAFSKLAYQGKFNQLSQEHVNWEIINNVSRVCEKERSSVVNGKNIINNFEVAPTIIKQRRSAVGYDGETTILKDNFFNIVKKTLEVNESMVHLIFFVHRVVGLESGLYILVRNREDLLPLKEKLSPSFVWRRVGNGLEFYLLTLGNFEAIAANISCGQAIAADGVFSLGMLANFEKTVYVDPSNYPKLFWESGIIGQVLYLAAEVENLRATGIGCFFDDEFHKFIGLKDSSFQSIYHFTIGKPVEDERLQTLPAYHHLKRE